NHCGIALNQTPNAENKYERDCRQPRQQQHDAQPTVRQSDTYTLPRNRQPAPGMPRQMAGPMLIALIEYGHYVCPIVLRNTSSSVLTWGRKKRICRCSSAATCQSSCGDCSAGM